MVIILNIKGSLKHLPKYHQKCLIIRKDLVVQTNRDVEIHKQLLLLGLGFRIR